MTDRPAPSREGVLAPIVSERLLDGVGRHITKIGLIVTAVVGINTAIVGCRDGYQQQYDHFHTAVRDEEMFYKGLFDDYDQALGLVADDDRRTSRIVAIQAMAKRPEPQFSSYRFSLLGSGDQQEKDRAAGRIARLKEDLLTLTVNTVTSGRKAAAAAQLEAFKAADASATRARVGQEVVPAAVLQTVAAAPPSGQSATAATAAAATYQAQVLSAGSAKGFDIDVFWCAGDDDRMWAAEARRAAGLLAARADLGKPVAPGVLFGRVRLRPVPAALQQQDGDAYRGLRVLFDDLPGDQAAAKAVLGVVNGSSPGPFRLDASRDPSRWYVSVFVCPSTLPGGSPVRRATPA